MRSSRPKKLVAAARLPTQESYDEPIDEIFRREICDADTIRPIDPASGSGTSREKGIAGSQLSKRCFATLIVTSEIKAKRHNCAHQELGME